MIRGTTPTHRWKLPIAGEMLKEVSITYQQNDEIIVKKTEADCEIGSDMVSVKLTQEDTLKLEAKVKTETQLKVLTTSGDVLATKPKTITVEDIHDEGVME